MLCHDPALPCLCWRQLQRAVGTPPGARIETAWSRQCHHCTALSLSAPAPRSTRATATYVPGSRRHGQGCVIILRCLVLAAPAPKSSRATFGCPDRDDMIKAVSSPCTALSLLAPAPQSTRATARCPHRDDMIKAVSSLHCLVFVGASSTEQSSCLQVPAPRRHDGLCHGCTALSLSAQASRSSRATFRCPD